MDIHPENRGKLRVKVHMLMFFPHSRLSRIHFWLSCLHHYLWRVILIVLTYTLRGTASLLLRSEWGSWNLLGGVWRSLALCKPRRRWKLAMSGCLNSDFDSIMGQNTWTILKFYGQYPSWKQVSDESVLKLSCCSPFTLPTSGEFPVLFCMASMASDNDQFVFRTSVIRAEVQNDMLGAHVLTNKDEYHLIVIRILFILLYDITVSFESSFYYYIKLLYEIIFYHIKSIYVIW